MRSLSQEVRERFLDAVAAGAPARAAGRRFALSPTTAIRWAKAWRADGTQAARPRGRQPGQGAKLAGHKAFLLGLIAAQRDITLHEVAARLAGEHGVTVALSTIWRFCAQQGITVKKVAHRALLDPHRMKAELPSGRCRQRGWFVFGAASP